MRRCIFLMDQALEGAFSERRALAPRRSLSFPRGAGPGTNVPGAVLYNRPDLSMELVYDMIRSEATQEFLKRGAEENEIASAFKKVLDDNPLPEFSELREFFAPTGMYVTSDETGIHMLGFQLKPDDDR